MSLLYGMNTERQIEESLFNWQSELLMVIVYNHQQLPLSFTPRHSARLASLRVSYDVTGRVTWWQRGDVIMTYVYDGVSGQLTEWTQTDQRRRLVHRYVYDQHSHAVSSCTFALHEQLSQSVVEKISHTPLTSLRAAIRLGCATLSCTLTFTSIVSLG